MTIAATSGSLAEESATTVTRFIVASYMLDSRKDRGTPGPSAFEVDRLHGLPELGPDALGGCRR
jgi:hypothetical protein